jgi:hypothetical protein
MVQKSDCSIIKVLGSLFGLALVFLMLMGCSQGVNGPDQGPSPVVIYYNPTNEASGIATNCMVLVKFSIPIDPSSINSNNFVVAANGTPISGTYSSFPLENAAGFTPSQNYASGTVFNVSVTSGIRSVRGVGARPQSWSFTSGSTTGNVPVIVARYPENNVTVETGQRFWIRFQPAMANGAINENSFTVFGTSGKITGTITYEPINAYYSFTPAQTLPLSTTFVATVSGSALSAQGIPLGQNDTWVFYTHPVTNPTVRFLYPIPESTNETSGIISGDATSPSTTIASVEYRIDGSPTWSSTTEDIHGDRFNRKQVSFKIRFSGLSDGQHTIQARAVDSTGQKTIIAEYAVNTFTIESSPFYIVNWHPNTAEAESWPTSESITFTFNRAIYGDDYRTAVTLWSSTQAIGADISAVGNTITFNPNANLAYSKPYYATIETSMRDSFGNHLATPFRWSFTTTNEPPYSVSWVLATREAIFGAYYGFGLFGAYFEGGDYMILAGGNYNGTITNEMFYGSNNGAFWGHHFQHMSGSARMNLSALHVSQSLYDTNYFIAGRAASGLTCETWRKEDIFDPGHGWVRADDGGECPPIEFTTIIQSLQNEDNLWMIGGSTETGYTNDAWLHQLFDTPGWGGPHSADPVFSPRCGHTLVTFEGEYWLIGGKTGTPDDNTYSDEIWKTATFPPVSWTQVSPGDHFSGRAFHTSVVYNNKIWVIGGMTANGPTNEVWCSEDGITWVKSADNPAFQARSQHGSIVFNNKVMVIGGKKANGLGTSEVWYFTD